MEDALPVPAFVRIFLLQYLAETGALSQEVIPAMQKRRKFRSCVNLSYLSAQHRRTETSAVDP
jgi:hypothetical protein